MMRFDRFTERAQEAAQRAAEIIQRPEIAFVSFTGSVRGYAFSGKETFSPVSCQNGVLVCLSGM